jgi:Fe2+ or Zn2+ uptake regulation protein
MTAEKIRAKIAAHEAEGMKLVAQQQEIATAIVQRQGAILALKELLAELEAPEGVPAVA